MAGSRGVGGAHRADHEVAPAVVLDDPRLGHRRGDIDHGRHDGLGHAPGDRRRVLDAVLQAEDERAGAEMRRHRVGHRFGVGRLDAEQHQVGALHRRELDARRDGHDLDPIGAFEAQARALDRLDVRGTADQGDGMAGLGERGAEEAADGAGTDDRDTMQGDVHSDHFRAGRTLGNPCFTERRDASLRRWAMSLGLFIAVRRGP